MLSVKWKKNSAQEAENPRYKCENILRLELDMPQRTTRDWEGPDPEAAGMGMVSLDPEASQVEIDEIVIQASPTVFRSSRKYDRPRTSKGKKSNRSSDLGPNSAQFPTSRGLVPR